MSISEKMEMFLAAPPFLVKLRLLQRISTASEHEDKEHLELLYMARRKGADSKNGQFELFSSTDL